MAGINDIQISIIIDGKQAQATLQLTEENLKKFATTAKQVTETTKQTSRQLAGGGGSMQQAIGQLGWAVGDAGGFLVNFRMGMMSIGNNIPMVVQSLAAARQEAAALGTTFKTQLLSSLMGTGGLMLGVNALMLALQVLPALFGKSGQAAKDMSEQVKEATANLDKMSTQTLRQRLLIEQMALQTLTSQAAREIAASTTTRKDKQGDEYVTAGTATSGTLSAINATKQMIEAIQDQINKMGVVGELENRLAELTSLRRTATGKELDQIIAEGQAIQKKLEQYSFNDKKSASAKDRPGVGLSDIGDRTLLKYYLNMINQGMAAGSLNDSAKPAQSLLRVPKNLGEISAQIKPVVNDTNELIDAIQGISAGFEDAGKSAIRGMSQSIYIFKQANSVLQQFMNTLLQVAFQEAALGMFKWLGKIINPGGGNLIESIFGNRATTGGTPLVVEVTGRSVTKGRDIVTVYDKTTAMKTRYQ